MQNPDQPNLPFAQRTNATMFRDMQNPDQPNLPFAQSSSSRSKMCYLVWSPTSPPNYKGTEMTLTDSTVISLRNKALQLHHVVVVVVQQQQLQLMLDQISHMIMINTDMIICTVKGIIKVMLIYGKRSMKCTQ